jgi:LysM repeat protein
MNISGSDLLTQVETARRQWAYISTVESTFKLPSWLLYAVGSRETNLRNIRGDGGHGRGVWQRDDRSWQIPADYDSDVHQQCVDAASLLADNIHVLGDVASGVAAYNCGRGGVYRARYAHVGVDTYTTGHDYSGDVLARRLFLVNHYAPKPPPSKPLPPLTPTGRIYVVKSGDTLTTIAMAHRTTVAKLVALNHLTNPDLIKVGQRLGIA